MNIIKQPNNIKFGRDSARDYEYPDKSLVITSKGATGRGWLEYTNLQNKMHYDDVEPNPSLDTAEKIISKFKNKDVECIIGLGGGSVLDVAKFVGYKLNGQLV